MFVPAEMSEVDIFVFDNDIEAVAQTVAHLGVMHLLDVNTLGKWAEGVSTEWAGRVSAYTGQERRVLELLSQLGIEPAPAPYEGASAPAEELVVIEQEVQEIEASTHDLRETEAVARRELERLQLMTHSVEILAPLSLNLSDLRQTGQLYSVAGTIPAENIARLEASLFRIPYSIIPVYRYQNRVLVFAFCAQEHAPILDRALESAFLDPLNLPEEFTGTAQEILDQVSQAAREKQQKLDEIEAKRQALAQELAPRLLDMLARIRRNRAISEAMAHFGHRGRVYLIAGWVPKDKVQSLRAAVERVAGGRVTFEENSPYAAGDKRVPTLLRQPGVFRPMQGLVATYGVPGYREIDPTPLVAVTFVLMFGMMFGDLGHGLSLAAVGAVLLLRLIPQFASLSSAGAILLACGLSSSVFGLLYGSFFGMEGIIPHLWLKPMDDILTLLGASVALGVVILNIGFGCRLLTAVREKKLAEAVFDKNGIVGLALYWALLSVVILMVLGKPVPGLIFDGIAALALMLFFAQPLTNLIRGKRPLTHGNLVEVLIEAFFELFEAFISYISNTLSYVRLGAFAVAHAGLSMVVFLLADMLGGGSVAGVMRLLVIVVGNIAIIGFEGLIVGIQTLRLEYYELFGKFFKGEGVPFKPLTLSEIK